MQNSGFFTASDNDDAIKARMDEEMITARRAQIVGMPYLDTTDIEKIKSDIISYQDILKLKAVPVRFTQDELIFGVTTTTSSESFKDLSARFLDQRVSFVIISGSGMNEYLRVYNPPKKVIYPDLDVEDIAASVERVQTLFEQVRPSDFLAYLVKQAFQLLASDIHIETQSEMVNIRFRVDGVLHLIAKISKEQYHRIISIVATEANISTAADAAQSGHIKTSAVMADGQAVDINLRVETVNSINGMDVVMRLFNFDFSKMNIDSLGLLPDEKALFTEILKHPSGLVMIVGPTGSGKTTTLYSILNALNTPERKIITLEDPVEFNIDGIIQINVNTAKNEKGFAGGLRNVLRLDPDVIMVGEIRDLDTAKTALQAALTGHLVLCTFHADSTAAAITRLLDAIEYNPLLASAIRLISAQRLMRKLVNGTPYQPEPAVIAAIENNIGQPLPAKTFYKPNPTPQNVFGYEGQIPIRENMVMTRELVNLISSRESISSMKIEELTKKQGMKTLYQRAIERAAAGDTSLEEIFRVLG